MNAKYDGAIATAARPPISALSRRRESATAAASISVAEYFFAPSEKSHSSQSAVDSHRPRASVYASVCESSGRFSKTSKPISSVYNIGGNF